MSIDSRTRAVPKPKETAAQRQAAMRAEIDMTRLRRKLSRCVCGHGEAVHIETGCAMECGCDGFNG